MALFAAWTPISTGPASAAPDLSSCGAKEFERYIGEPVETLERLRQNDVRYVCAGCAMTMDFRANRLTVVYGDKTGRIKKLGCN